MSAEAPISPPPRKKSLPAPEESAPPSKTLKVMTWNVAALRTIPSKLGTSEFQNKVPMNDVLSAFFKKYKVDIACIQEHKFSGWDKLDKEYACVEGLSRAFSATDEAGYDSFWSFSGSGYAGVVTYARTGLTESFTDNPFGKEDGDKEIRALTQGRCMLTRHSGFSILNIYAPNAGRGPEHLEKKMAFYNELSSAMARWTEEGQKVVVTGDINTAHSDLDIYNPQKYGQETGYLEIERNWISTFLNDRKCKDVWRQFNPGVRKYTFWDQKRLMREKNCGWRIDVYYANEPMMKDVISSDILNDIMGSDHCPISLTLKDTTTNTFPTPPGAGNIRKATRQQTLKSFFQPGAKRPSSSSPVATTKRSRLESSKAMEIKEDSGRKPVHRGDSSQETDDSDHEEILRRAFGVKRAHEEVGEKDRDESSIFLAEHRKREAEWRKQHGS